MQVALGDYVWAAGVATDLANTGADVWRGDDHLADLAALAAFADLHDDPPGGGAPLGAAARRADAAGLSAVHALRATVRDLIGSPERDRLIGGATALTGTARGATLAPDPARPGRARWALEPAPAADVAGRLSLVCGVGVLGVLHALGTERFRPCAAPGCRGVFIDATRPGRRRYCMPGLCGNRVNVANHRARRAAQQDIRPPGTT